MGNHHAINGQINYFYGHFQELFVCLPEGTTKWRVSMGFLNGKSSGNMDDLGGIPISRNLHMVEVCFFLGKRLTDENCGWTIKNGEIWLLVGPWTGWGEVFPQEKPMAFISEVFHPILRSDVFCRWFS